MVLRRLSMKKRVFLNCWNGFYLEKTQWKGCVPGSRICFVFSLGMPQERLSRKINAQKGGTDAVRAADELRIVGDLIGRASLYDPQRCR